MTQPQASTSPVSIESTPQRFHRIRQTSLDLAAPLAVEDMVVQSMPDASPTRWHLAHITWFFEHFLLAPRLAGFQPYREGWDYLFNSYYYTVGDMYKRPERGLLSRPTVSEILDYRAHVDAQMAVLIDQNVGDEQFLFLLELGLNHEQQHQELMLTDIKHALSCNPLQPAYREDLQAEAAVSSSLNFIGFDGGIVEMGCDRSEFCFDNETPRHRVLLNPFEFGSRLVSNCEYLEFIREGGYRHPEFWLSDGWSRVLSRQQSRPCYWSEDLSSEFSLLGQIELDPHRPVCHVSYYEADAFARWYGARLPSESEWEQVAMQQVISGNLLDEQKFHPAGAHRQRQINQMYGDLWEWTQSAYSPYPGFKPLAGSLGEYNGKFMCSQIVLKGGSCATPQDHIRPSYRNFFYPDKQWQFSGIRLARDS